MSFLPRFACRSSLVSRVDPPSFRVSFPPRFACRAPPSELVLPEPASVFACSFVSFSGSGPDCDGQFIFSEDLIGTNSGHYPRHCITYTHLFKDAIRALTQYREDVLSGAYPTAKHTIKIKDEEFARFMEAIS